MNVSIDFSNNLSYLLSKQLNTQCVYKCMYIFLQVMCLDIPLIIVCTLHRVHSSFKLQFFFFCFTFCFRMLLLMLILQLLFSELCKTELYWNELYFKAKILIHVNMVSEMACNENRINDCWCPAGIMEATERFNIETRETVKIEIEAFVDRRMIFSFFFLYFLSAYVSVLLSVF